MLNRRLIAFASFLGLIAFAQPCWSENATLLASSTAKAAALAGDDLKYLTLLCKPVQFQGEAMGKLPMPVSPFKIFDNVYFLGTNRVSSLAITTSRGIILIDAMNNTSEADQYILGGLKKAGLDPQQVKYILITHGHGDHYGGARELKAQIPGARLLMGAADWDFAAMRPKKQGQDLPPARDMSVTDGQKVMLGDETITVYVTPGHTPGSLAMIIPIKYQGVTHVMSLWGGTTFFPEPYGLAEFRISLDRFRNLERAAHSEGRLSTHPMWTGATIKMDEMRSHPSSPNPFFESASTMDRYTKVQDACYEATVAQVPN